MKNNKNIVEFFSSLPKMMGVFPEPEPTSMNIPEWYKKQLSYSNNDKTPVNGHQTLTIKKCMAISDVLLMGYVLKAPSDIYIDTTNEEDPKYEMPGNLTFSRPIMGGHGEYQYDQMPIDKDFYVRKLLRVNMIWLVKTMPGYSCLFLNPQLGDELPISAIPGVMDTDSFISSGLMSFLVKKNYKGVIKKGTPLLQVIPFKREDYTHKIVQDMEIASKLKKQDFSIRTYFNSGYKKLFWKPKKYR
jgi:hypothetical protein